MSASGRRRWCEGPWNQTAEIYRHTLMLPRDIAVAPVQPFRAKGARGTEDKTGEATRQRIRTALLKRWGPYCHLCLAWGASKNDARIDLTLSWPDPECFTRDHVKPRSMGGSWFGVRNQRPAHNRCNRHRGNTPMEKIAERRPAWVAQEEAA